MKGIEIGSISNSNNYSTTTDISLILIDENINELSVKKALSAYMSKESIKKVDMRDRSFKYGDNNYNFKIRNVKGNGSIPILFAKFKIVLLCSLATESIISKFLSKLYGVKESKVNIDYQNLKYNIDGKSAEKFYFYNSVTFPESITTRTKVVG